MKILTNLYSTTDNLLSPPIVSVCINIYSATTCISVYSYSMYKWSGGLMNELKRRKGKSNDDEEQESVKCEKINQITTTKEHYSNT